MSKEPIMTDFLKELKIITESTHDKDIRNAVNLLTNYELRKQGWTDEDFEWMGEPKEWCNGGNIDFADIFRYFEKKWNISWNKCNELLFREGVLEYKSYDDIILSDLLTYLPEGKESFDITKEYWDNLVDYIDDDDDIRDTKGIFLLGVYMTDKKYDEMTVLNGK
jgi:hypothetical protein